MNSPKRRWIRNSTCTISECTRKHFGKGLCRRHWEHLPEVKAKRAEKAKQVAKTPKRKKQKAEAQLRYQITDKAAISQFKRWSKKQKKPVLLQDSDVLELRQLPCHKCSGPIERTGVCFTLINPRGPIDRSNVTPTCGICKMIKPKERFDPIAFAKATIRRAWKKTPMVAIARKKANKAIGRYECNGCKGLFSERDMELDHIDPVVDPIKGYVNLDTFVLRLLCDEENLQLLCINCHLVKTSQENKQRAHARKERKKNEHQTSTRPTSPNRKRTSSRGNGG